MSIKIPNKYTIKFNGEKMPINFDKWIKLDIYYENNSKISLNSYLSVVIKTKEKYIQLEIGGNNYIIYQNYIYFPFFPKYHNCIITLNSNIDIYIVPEHNTNNELNKLMIDNTVIFYNINIIDYYNNPTDIYQYLLGINGMLFGTSTKKIIDVDIEKFYYEYENKNENKVIDVEKINDNIILIDYYYQHEFIKICKLNE